MAKATRQVIPLVISEEEKRRIALEDLEKTLLENKELIEQTFEIMQGMQKRNILPAINSLLKEGDKVMDILIKKANTKETANMLKNMLLLVGTLGTLNVKQLEPIILKLNSGIARVSEEHHSGGKASYFSILRSLNDKEIKQAMAFLMEFLKGIGEDTEPLERTTQLPEDQQLHQSNETSDIELPRAQKSYGTSFASNRSERISSTKKSKSSWLWIAAGASIVTIPLLLSKKDKQANQVIE